MEAFNFTAANEVGVLGKVSPESGQQRGRNQVLVANISCRSHGLWDLGSQPVHIRYEADGPGEKGTQRPCLGRA